MKRNILKQSGFTLLELLATITISGIFITIIFSVVTTAFTQNDKTLSHINLRQEANHIITKIRNQHQENEIICEKDLLGFKTQNFVINIENFSNNKECSNPEEDLAIKFTLADYENNEYTIDTIIEKKQSINSGNPEIGPTDSFYDFLAKENVFIYGSKYAFSGNSTDGPNGKMIILGDINSSELNGGSMSNVSNIEVQGSILLDGGSAGIGSKASPGTIIIQGSFTSWSGTRKIYGDIYVNGDFRIKDAQINGNIFVDGNVEIGWTPELSQNSFVYYTGTITFPKDMSKSITDKFIKSDTVPKKPLTNKIQPTLKTKEWFTENGYTSSLEDKVNNKIYVQDFNYSWNGWQPSGDIFQNLVIVSEKDITLTSVWNQTMTGVLFAPNGKVTFNGSNFQGVIISKDGVYITSGGTNVKLKNIAEFFPNKESAPFY